LWQIGEFSKDKKNKIMVMIFTNLLSSFYILGYIVGKNKRFWQNFTIFFSLVTIENL
jgi:hypothetical protein